MGVRSYNRSIAPIVKHDSPVLAIALQKAVCELGDEYGSTKRCWGVYSAVLGFFVPSGGGKWLIEAPYLMQSANQLHAHLGWAVQVYNAAEAMPNLVNPFWMLPLLGIVGLKARDVIGFSFLQFAVHLPMVLFLLWLLGLSLTYHPPVMPAPS
jgi:short-chain fatty acids transporter